MRSQNPTEMSTCEELAKRLQLIAWNEKNFQRKSQVRLLQEYLRRSALWAQELGRGAWPFYDIAQIIAPSVRAPQQLVKETRRSLSSTTYYVLHTAEWALHFAQLEDSGAEIPDLPHPYFPLTLLHERGDTINYISAGFFIEVGITLVPRGKRERYAHVPALTDFSERHLDELDRDN